MDMSWENSEWELKCEFCGEPTSENPCVKCKKAIETIQCDCGNCFECCIGGCQAEYYGVPHAPHGNCPGVNE